MQMLSERNLKIFQLLRKYDQGITGEELSKLIGVSSRTIRSDMRILADYLKEHGGLIQSDTRAGYRLEIIALTSFLEFERNCPAEENIGDAAGEDRVYAIMKILLFNALENKQITQMDLADTLYVSISTLKLSLKAVEKKLEKYQLKVVRYKTKGIQITGNEAQVRYCIAEYVFNQKKQEAGYVGAFYQALFKALDLREIEQIILRVIAQKRMKLTDMAIKNLLVHTAIAIERARHANHIVYTVSQTQKIEQMPEFVVAKEIFDEIYIKLGLDIAAGEVYYLAQHLIASKKYSDTDADEAQIAAHIEGLLHEIMRGVNEAVKIDFSDDEHLRKWLILHLKAALTRMQFNMNMRNEVLDVIKSEYPLAFQIAVIASRVIEVAEGVRVNENEIGYIAIHFGAALSRKGVEENSHLKSAIIVCATGIGTAVLIKTKIEEHFKNQIKVVRTMSGYELDEAATESVDLILTTVPIAHIQSEKIIEVKHLLNQVELARIKQRVFGQITNKQVWLEAFFRADCFYGQEELKSKDAVLAFLTEEMIKKGLMSEKTKASVVERETASTTEIGNLVAIPHPMYNDMAVSSIAVLILDKPILWDEHQVQVVFLINITQDKFNLWETIFLKLFDYLVKENGVKTIIKDRSYQKFINSFRKKFE